MSNTFRSLLAVWMPAVLLIGMAGIPAQAHTVDTRPRTAGVLQALEAEIATLFDTNRRCVVRIHTIYGGASENVPFELGSGYTHGTGFLIDDAGHILTVDKAVSGASEIRITLADGETAKAAFIASDPASDVAVIRALAPTQDHMTLGNSRGVRVGHYTFILGNAFGQLMPSIGSVYEVTDREDLIQITSSVYPSYGGAPVFNSSGEVMGMVWAAPIYPDDRSLVAGVADLPTSVFLIPINRAKRIADTLIERGRMAYGWLGVDVDRESHPVVVTKVAEGGPAWRSGIRPGDRIVSYNGSAVAGPFHLERLVMETPPGESVPIRVRRESITMSTQAQVQDRELSDGVLNPYGQLAGMSGHSAVATKRVPGQELQDQIHTLEREIGRLRQLMNQSSP